MTQLLAIIAILCWPLTIYLMRRYPNHRNVAFVAVALLSLMPNVPIGYIYGWPAWAGPVAGIAIPFSFVIALALMVTRRGRLGKIPFIGIISLYGGCIALSILFARMWMATVFSIWQFALVTIIFLAVAGEAYKTSVRDAILFGFSLGLIFQAGNSIIQRAGGAAQAGGTFGHQNILGLALELSIIPLLGAALAGRHSTIQTLGIIAGGICVVSSGSRATIGIIAVCVVFLAVLSLIRRSTPQKLRAVFFGLVLVGLAIPLAIGSLNARFQGQTYFTQDLERVRFESAANEMARENPFGVGANNYVFVSNSEGYADDTGIGWQRANRSVPVHNAYLLAKAEMGWVGQIAFALIVSVPLVFGILFAFKDRKTQDGDIVLGSVVALMANMLHNLYEFAVHTYSIQSLLLINVALISAAIRKQELVRRSRRQIHMNARKSNQPILEC